MPSSLPTRYIDWQRPWPLQSLLHCDRAQPAPVQPTSQVHWPVARSQVPCDAHSVHEWAVLAANEASAHVTAWGHDRMLQSDEALNCESHVHASPAPHDPWPLQWFGQPAEARCKAARAASASTPRTRRRLWRWPASGNSRRLLEAMVKFPVEKFRFLLEKLNLRRDETETRAAMKL